MTAVYRALRVDEQEECLNLWLTVWPGECSHSYFQKYFHGDVEWLPYYTQVAECNGRLVSAVHICKRTVACGEFSLTMGGIANVATLPEYRGRGYNTGCLKSAIEVMEADAMDFSLLFTGINSYYRKFGFADLARERVSVIVRPNFQPAQSQYLVRRAGREDMPAIRKIYDEYNQNRPITVKRSEAYWRDWMRFYPNDPPTTLTLAATDSGAIVGYVYTGVFNSAAPYDADDAEARIIELCSSNILCDDEEAVASALLNNIAAALPAFQERKLVLEVAITPGVLRALAAIGGEGGIERGTISAGMVRLLHRTNLLNSLCMCAYEGWQNNGSPGGKLIFETPYGNAEITAGSTLPRAAEWDGGTDGALALSQSDLFSLLFGCNVLPLKNNEIGLLNRELITSLFPQRYMVYWGVDGF